MTEFFTVLLTGCAFVTFTTRAMAQTAIKAMHQAQTMEVGSKWLSNSRARHSDMASLAWPFWFLHIKRWNCCCILLRARQTFLTLGLSPSLHLTLCLGLTTLIMVNSCPFPPQAPRGAAFLVRVFHLHYSLLILFSRKRQNFHGDQYFCMSQGDKKKLFNFERQYILYSFSFYLHITSLLSFYLPALLWLWLVHIPVVTRSDKSVSVCLLISAID